MYFKEANVSLLVGFVSILASIKLYTDRENLHRKVIHIVLPLLSTALHILPFFIPFFISTPARIRRILNGSIYSTSLAISVTLFAMYLSCNSFKIFTGLFVIAYLLASLFETSLYFWKWHTRSKKRKEFKNRPLIRRRYGNGEIKMPPISVSTEVKHLRAKNDFVFNGAVYIRKGETVELLKPIGSYYSVRTSTGTEYIVPKENFF
ncbi:hypothetical protein NEMIN01_0404 [Nematocida minor]|uniref:uncharacterized protein n=1 Tax=Nematocida minor TaxID=1912983 RepID=UPI00221EE206|nr:uncharacterized protein NEMIN01_0404 [Nematocida minor]KAI5189238.1 hypothetical protein NEMIN01_0404 [Nematocida minor]